MGSTLVAYLNIVELLYQQFMPTSIGSGWIEWGYHKGEISYTFYSTITFNRALYANVVLFFPFHIPEPVDQYLVDKIMLNDVENALTNLSTKAQKQWVKSVHIWRMQFDKIKKIGVAIALRNSSQINTNAVEYLVDAGVFAALALTERMIAFRRRKFCKDGMRSAALASNSK